MILFLLVFPSKMTNKISKNFAESKESGLQIRDQAFLKIERIYINI